MSKRGSGLGTIFVAALSVSVGLGLLGGAGTSKDTPGITATEIKIGQTMPYTGAGSAYGVIGKGEAAYFQMINEQGGINGRKINLVSVDDSASPPKTVEQIRKLVEQENVAFIFNPLGTASSSAVQKYLNQKKIPQLFVASGAAKWADPKNFPWTMGWQPSYRTEAAIYAKHILRHLPDAKVCVLYQNDDFGKDYIAGLKEGFGAAEYEKRMLKELSYESTDPTVDSQVVTLQATGCNALVSAAGPKFAAQAIRKIYDIGWRPTHFMTNTSISLGTVLRPAGLEKAVGLITAGYLKDVTDDVWRDDPGAIEYKAFMAKHMPTADIADGGYTYAYGVAQTMVKVLQQCGDDLSRENIMKQAASLKNLQVASAQPGILINTSADDFRPFSQMRLAKFDGQHFQRFGDIISSE
jgi:branched-chain amino acid transport system substrate-binding protein